MADTLKARLPRGFADRPAADLAATDRMIAKIRETYELYGFEALETPFVEYTEALGKFLPDQDRPNEGVFSFQDDDAAWLSLRYDLTAPLARHVAERLDQQSLTLPYRSYRAGWVFRNEKPGPGRFRQFMQFDADTVGSSSPAADAEICMMMADTLEAVGIQRGQYVVKVNNRKILDGVMEAIGLGGDENEGRRLIVLRALDKYDRLGEEGVRLILGAGRKDESGDFTKGAELDLSQIDQVLLLLSTFDEMESDALEPDEWPADQNTAPTVQATKVAELVLARLSEATNGSGLGMTGVEDLRQLWALVVSGRYDGRIRIDPSVVRGLEYYTGPVFEAELTIPIVNEDGQTVRFGSIGGGGRYDGLVGRFRSEPVPATGFSIGVSRLQAALQHVTSPIVSSVDARGPVVVLVMDKDPGRIGDYQRMVAKLRAAKIPAEMYLGQAGMKAQMKYADRRRAPCVVIQGSQEKERGQVQIKDLVAGAAEAGRSAGASHQDYKAARLAQVSVAEDDLVDEIRKMLARHRHPDV